MRFNASVNPPLPSDPPPRLVIEADSPELAERFARERLGSAGFIIIRNPDPDVELRTGKDGVVWIREIPEGGKWLGDWRRL